MAVRTSSKVLLFFVFVVAGGLIWIATRANDAEIDAAVAEQLQEAYAAQERTLAEQQETLEAEFAEKEKALEERAEALETAIANVEEPVFYAVTPAHVEAVLQKMGMQYEQGVDGDDDPKFTFKLATYDVTMYFYGCQVGGCTSLRLYSGFNLNDPIDADHLNEWNRTKRFGTGYRTNSGAFALDEDLIVKGGVTAGAIEQFLIYYRDRLNEFTTHIGF